MIKHILFTAAALLAFGSMARASTVDILLGATTNTDGFTSGANALSPNIALTGNTNLSLSNASIYPAGYNSPGVAASPTGSLYGNEYLAVGSNSSSGIATFSLAQNGNSFGLTWGSIDSYNTLVLTDSRNVSYTITGAELNSYLSTIGNAPSQTDVSINDPFGRIVSVSLESTSAAFEASNFSGSAVPLPASSMLFAMALAGLAFVGFRKQKSRI